MVRYLIYLFLMLPSCLLSGEFAASVNRNQVALGESFTLSLKLADVSAEGSPYTAPLKKSFVIHSQHQSSNTVIVNWKASSSTTWQYTLIPKKEGELTIPSINIDTSEGALATNPIEIRVAKRTAGSDSNSPNGSGMTLTARVSKAKPFKNEPIAYTVKLISKQDLANVQIQKIPIEDAVIEMTGEPEVEEKIVDGIRIKTIEINYLITPLKAGPLTIPSTVIQGGVPVKRKTRFDSFFDDDFHSFSMMRPFDRLEPFALSTGETVLEVQPPAAGVNPWLPAHSLGIEENWDDSQTITVGEPLTRSFKIAAEGVRAGQLPSLHGLQISDDAFKIYADKPEMGDQVENGIVKSYRKEQYTLIPQRAGALTLPEITITWWDVAKNAAAFTRVPSRTFEVLPAPETSQTNGLPPAAAIAEPQAPPAQSSPLLYALVAGLAVLLLFAFFWGISLQKKISRLTDTPKNDAPKKREKPLPIHLKELESIATAKQLQQFLQSYARQQWNIPQNSTLKAVCEEMRKRCPENLSNEIFFLEKKLEDALYRSKEVEINEIVKRCSFILEQTTETASASVKKERLPDLNPS